ICARRAARSASLASSNSSNSGVTACQRALSNFVMARDGSRFFQCSAQKDTRAIPVAMQSAPRHAAHLRDLFKAESAEELQIDKLRELGLDVGELEQGLAKPAEILERRLGLRDFGIQRRDVELAA